MLVIGGHLTSDQGSEGVRNQQFYNIFISGVFLICPPFISYLCLIFFGLGPGRLGRQARVYI